MKQHVFLHLFLYKILFLGCILCVPLKSYASSSKGQSACQQRKLGWHFYCDEPKPSKKEKKEKVDEVTSLRPREQLAQIQQKLEDLRIEAIMDPSQENIMAYIAYQQKEVLERSAHFSMAWKKALWQEPSLNYSVKIPTMALADHVYSDEQNRHTEEILLSLSQRYGLFFFYQGACPYCKVYAPLLRAFSDRYSIPIIAVSLDYHLLPEFPQSVVDSGQFEVMGMEGKPVPATLLFDKKKSRVIPIGFGVLSDGELEERIVTLVKEQKK